MRSRGRSGQAINLFEVFQDAGLPAPAMHLEIPLGSDSTIVELQTDLLRALVPAAEEHGVSVAALGDLDTLPERVYAALDEAKSPICFIAMVSAWSRKTP